jgi:hypothetical protein
MSFGSLSQQIELVFDHPVTLAGRPLQLLTMEDLDVPANVTDCPGILEVTCSYHSVLLNFSAPLEVICVLPHIQE